MKKFFILFLLFSCSLFAQNVNVSDYDKAISSARILRFTGSYNWAQTGDSVTSDNGNADMTFKAFYSSQPFAWFIDAYLKGLKNKNDYSHEANFSADGRKYLLDEQDLFTFSKLSIKHQSSFKQIESDITFGAGYGRYINATTLAKAVRIEEHLIRDKVITERLPKNTMIKIANIIEREDEYKNIYSDIYETFWLSDIEREVVASGLVKGEKIGAIGILRIRQVLIKFSDNIAEVVNERYYGWDIKAGAKFGLTTKDKSPVGSPKLSLSGNYSYPINWKMQINSTGEINTPMDSSMFKGYDLNVGADYIYELGNRINFVTRYRFSLKKVPLLNPTSEQNLGITFLFYMENNIYLSLNGNINKIENTPTKLSLSVNIQYNVF